jgi:DtxR family transcriptional regulator, Mn-dependent transcriptional regulator
MEKKRMTDIEEALSVIWNKINRGIKGVKEINDILVKGELGDIFVELVKKNFVRVEKDEVVLTPEGDEIGKNIVRRHRLAERLLTDVLELKPEEIDKTACEIEHIISADVTQSICTLLGHPKVCPHGSPIPPGPCCEAKGENIESIVTRLDTFDVGETGRIAYIVTGEHPRLHKLLSMGLVPGIEIRLHGKFPSFVITVGHTQIALDAEVAKDIYVRRTSQ